MKKYIVFIEHNKYYYSSLSQYISSNNSIVASYENNVLVKNIKSAFEEYLNSKFNKDYEYLQIFCDYKNIETYETICDFSKNRRIIFLYYKKIRILPNEEKIKYENGIEAKINDALFDVFYKKLNGSTGVIKCSENYTIGELIYSISKKENYEMNNHKFWFAGKEMNNHNILIKDFGIKKESTVHIALNINTQQQILQNNEEYFYAIFTDEKMSSYVKFKIESEIDDNININIDVIVL